MPKVSEEKKAEGGAFGLPTTASPFSAAAKPDAVSTQYGFFGGNTAFKGGNSASLFKKPEDGDQKDNTQAT